MIRSRSQKVRRATVAHRATLAETSGRGPGRPPAEIPKLILDYAVAQWLKLESFSAVVQLLEREKLGTFPINTLKRHILRRKHELDVQFSDPSHY